MTTALPEPDDVRRVTARLTRAGFADSAAAFEALGPSALGLWNPLTNTAVDDAAALVVSALGRAADPDQAVRRLLDLVRAGPDLKIVDALRNSAAFRQRLIGVLGFSAALAEHLVRRPEDALRLDTPADRPDVGGARERLIAAVGADPDSPVTGSAGVAASLPPADATAALRDAYRAELVEVAGYDLAGELTVADVGAALADLAGYVLEAGLAVARAALGERVPAFRLAVIGMGKAGGRELNYVSDVDVIFVAEPGEPVGGAHADVDAALAAATRLASGVMRICAEAAWEVDAALRPEGKSGVLVRTLASHEAYYRRWASTWEFQALLKARPIAGDAALGQSYLDAVSPLIWRAAERPNFVLDVQAMRRRVVAHLPPDIADRELKLGPGGLRDVEFAVQLLQLVHGRADESLRVGSTLAALAALRDGGYVGRDDGISLSDAYTFLRSTEHHIQLVRLRRTHLVPDDRGALVRLARSMGFRADARGDAEAVWQHEWALHGREVRRLHEKLFYRPLLQSVARVPSESLRLSPDEARRRLEALGYADPTGALRHLQTLTAGVSRRAAIQRALLPVILSDLADSPDPDSGLLAYRQVSDALGGTPWFLRLLRDEGTVATRLARVLGSSRYVSHMLVRAPEALQMLADDSELEPRRHGEIETVMLTSARRQESPTAAAHVIRSARRQELLRIAFAQLVGLADDSAVRIALSELADATLGASLATARAAVAAERSHGDDLGIDFAVIAMGRLGGQEMGYSSDADVLFVYDRRPGGGDGLSESEAAERAHAVADRLRAMLATPSTDPPLHIDANLRPEGRDGPLVRSLGSYGEYYARWSSIWEAQALLRARFCAGDPGLGERFVELIDPIRYPDTGLDPAQVTEIRRIKGRVDAERLPRGADPSTHTKLGRGGLADVEWTAQLLQLRYACDVAGLRTTATIPALRAAARAGHVTDDQAAALEGAWRLSSRVRDAVMLVRDRPDDQLPTQGRVLSGVAHVLGYQPGSDPGQLVDDYRRAARRCRRVVEAVFYDSAI